MYCTTEVENKFLTSLILNLARFGNIYKFSQLSSENSVIFDRIKFTYTNVRSCTLNLATTIHEFVRFGHDNFGSIGIEMGNAEKGYLEQHITKTNIWDNIHKKICKEKLHISKRTYLAHENSCSSKCKCPLTKMIWNA